MNSHAHDIPGYDYGTDKVAKSPITLDEWEALKKSALFSEENAIYLRLSRKVLAGVGPSTLAVLVALCVTARRRELKRSSSNV